MWRAVGTNGLPGADLARPCYVVVGVMLCQKLDKESVKVRVMNRLMCLLVLIAMGLSFGSEVCWADEGLGGEDRVGVYEKLDWLAIPKPARVIRMIRPSTQGEIVVQQTLSGLLALQGRERGASWDGLWIEFGIEVYEEWLQIWAERTGAAIEEGEQSVWDLMRRYHEAGLVKGYVLYSETKTVATAEDAGDLSVNIATGLCGVLNAVAVEAGDESRVKAMGLQRLVDCRDKDMGWLYERYGDWFDRKYLMMLPPDLHTSRAMGITSRAMIGIDTNKGGMHEALKRAESGGMMFGWGLNEESVFVEACSKVGMRVSAANHSLNMPILASGALKIEDVLRVDEVERAEAVVDEAGKHYVAFMMSDGDNLCWMMGGFTSDEKWYGAKNRGAIPFGWGMCSRDLLEASPAVWRQNIERLKENETVVDQNGGGYFYVDRMPRKGVEKLAKRFAKTSAVTGVEHVGLFSQRWDSEAAKRSYEIYAKVNAGLKGIFAVQYSPYAAGQGRVIFVGGEAGVKRGIKEGKERGIVPVLSSLTSIWKLPWENEYEGSPKHVAKTIEAWASKKKKRGWERFTWVSVHAWSDFGGGVAGYEAAVRCAALLGDDVEVVSPRRLVEMLRDAKKRETR
ncbi:hypothetical protein KS4_26890 [Poriferisphaera corsica]|uniref:Uncharacterized protein n=2 Tax=Poriferisphaera corsica TaxID=2528020 RepID=A0A517YWL4_9BACT|nr:hypothetical protein KS4_26890 [Poriferisphaera corsica]